MARTYYKHGSHNFECDICRDWLKAEDKRKMWNGSIVCPDCWDPKPWFMMKYPRVEDLRPVRDARPQAEFTFQDGSSFGAYTLWEEDGTMWDNDNLIPGMGEWNY